MKTVFLVLALFSLSGIAPGQEPAKEGDHPADKKPEKELPRTFKPAAEEQERLARMKREMVELHRAGKHDEAERLAKQLHAAAERHDAEQKQPRQKGAEKERRQDFQKLPAAEGADRLGHLQQAIRHLHAAGLHEPARDLEQAAGKMREQLEHHAHAAGRPDGDHAAGRELHRELQEVREQLRKISQELQEIREHTRRERPDR